MKNNYVQAVNIHILVDELSIENYLHTQARTELELKCKSSKKKSLIKVSSINVFNPSKFYTT